MTRISLIAFCGAVIAVLVIAGLAGATLLAPRLALSGQPGWQAATPEIGVGENIRLEVRLTGVDDLPGPDDVTVTSTRLDMGPDGMGAMTTRIEAVPSDKPGILAFEADISMAGRWALTLTAKIPAISDPVTGSVIFTAVENKTKSDATDASGGDRKIAYYRHPMGLSDTSAVPKKDSMGMDYIPVYEDELTGPPGSVEISLAKVQRAGVRTQVAQREHLGRTILASGTVKPDEARVWIASAKFSGFIEELHVAATGAKVAAGQPLMTIWIENGDLLRKQADYLTALTSASRGNGDEGVIRARRNLQAFDFPADALEAIRRERAPTRSIVMRARAAGTVLEKTAIEGMRFEPGHAHFKIADLTRLWVIADVAERDLGIIERGQTATMRFPAYPGETFEGRVSFIYPDVDMATRTGQVRIELPNPDGRIKIGFYADVRIDADAAAGQVLAVPESAVIDNGARRVVIVANGEGRFEPRDVKTGARGEGKVQILEGLEPGEEIVTTGNFLIDAESNLRAALSAFAAPATAAADGGESAAARAQ